MTKEIVWLYILGRVVLPGQRREIEAARAGDPAVAGWFELLLGTPEREPPDGADTAHAPEPSGAARRALRTLRPVAGVRASPQPLPAIAPTFAFASTAVPVEWEVVLGTPAEGQQPVAEFSCDWCVARLWQSPGLSLELSVAPAARGNGVARFAVIDRSEPAALVHGDISLDGTGHGAIRLDELDPRLSARIDPPRKLRLVLEPPARSDPEA